MLLCTLDGLYECLSLHGGASDIVQHHTLIVVFYSPRDYPLLLIEEYMNLGDLLAVLKESRPHMELVQQLSFAWQTADGMDYLASIL